MDCHTTIISIFTVQFCVLHLSIYNFSRSVVVFSLFSFPHDFQSLQNLLPTMTPDQSIRQLPVRDQILTNQLHHTQSHPQLSDQKPYLLDLGPHQRRLTRYPALLRLVQIDLWLSLLHLNLLCYMLITVCINYSIKLPRIPSFYSSLALCVLHLKLFFLLWDFVLVWNSLCIVL